MAYEDEVAAIAVAVANPGMDVATPLQAILDAILGGGLIGFEAITRTAYDLLDPPTEGVLYIINESL